MRKMSYAYMEDPLMLFRKHVTDNNGQQEFNDSNFAVLDSPCSVTVCWENWLDYYLQSLSWRDWRKVRFKGSSTAFKGG